MPDIFDALVTSPNPYANGRNVQELMRHYLGKVQVPVFINATDLAAGTAQQILAPFKAYVSNLTTIVQVAIGTGGTIQVKVGTTDITGCLVTLADSDAAGVIDNAAAGGYDYNAVPTLAAVAAYGRVQVAPAAAFATAGAVMAYVEFTPRA